MSDLLTIPEAAARRGCSETAIRHAITDGRLPPYDDPKGVRHVWAADVDRMDAPRATRRSSGEPLLIAAEVPGDDAALSAAFDLDELRLLSYALTFTFHRARLHIRERPIVERLMRRFYRLTTTRSST